jgi:alanine racemase
MNHRVRVEIDIGALVRNYRRIVRHVSPAEVLCVLKAGAYGLGVAGYARELAEAGCRRFGVAEPFEAMELLRVLRGSGAADAGSRVQILSSVLPDEIVEMVDAGVVLPVTGLAEAEAIGAAAVRLGKRATVHLKIDSGMGRLGILAEEAVDTVGKIVKTEGLDCEGVFSHCPVAYDPSDPFTAEQIAAFSGIVSRLADKGILFRYVHIAASDAINNFPAAAALPFNMVRTGINLHGSFDPQGRRVLDVEPVLTLKTRVAQVRELPAGTTLGYGRTWKLGRKTRVATVSAGYADGLPLALTNRGEMFIGGVRCPVIGRISMDYATVDVSAVESVECGDEVICLGKCGDDAITPDDWARIKGTHAYDIICSLGARVERVLADGRLPADEAE